MSEAWKAVIDSDLKDAEYTPRAPIEPGTYNAFVSNIVAKTFETKSKGVEITYVITDEGENKGREIKDWNIIVTSEGAPNKQGPALIKKLMMACGLSTAEIHKFKFPDFDSKAFGDFKKLLEQPLLLEVNQQVQKKGKNVGKTFARVANFKAAA